MDCIECDGSNKHRAAPAQRTSWCGNWFSSIAFDLLWALVHNDIRPNYHHPWPWRWAWLVHSSKPISYMLAINAGNYWCIWTGTFYSRLKNNRSELLILAAFVTVWSFVVYSALKCVLRLQCPLRLCINTHAHISLKISVCRMQSWEKIYSRT